MPASLTPPSDPDRNAATTDHPVPSRLVRGAVTALFTEAALAALAAGILVVRLLATATGSDGAASGPLIGMDVFLVLCAAGLAAVLVGAGRALRRGRRSGRAIAFTWQLFQAVIGVTAVASGSGPAVVALGVLLLVLAVGVVVLLLTPGGVEATTRG